MYLPTNYIIIYPWNSPGKRYEFTALLSQKFLFLFDIPSSNFEVNYESKNRIITAVLLSASAAVGTALINKYIKMSAVSRNLLAQPEPRCYRWRLGNIYYTKTGTGKPLLLVHDLTHASSGCEWDSLIPLLKEHYTIYTIDLLGCGRSEKPNLTYTNFLYVQLLNDFVKSEIGRRTNIVATGASARSQQWPADTIRISLSR